MSRLLLLLLLPCAVWAGGEGTWQASGVGATLNYRGVVANSLPLKAPAETQGVITLIAWRYQLLNVEPAGLIVKLCAGNQCAVLDGASGSTRVFAGLPAGLPMQFVWEVPGRGSFYPPLRVTSNQVIVNYK